MKQYHDFAHTSDEMENPEEVLEEYQASTGQRFADWFPEPTWGSIPFRISFIARDFGVTVSRGKNTILGRYPVNVDFSEFFVSHFKIQTQAYFDQRIGLDGDFSNSITESMRTEKRIHDVSERAFASRLGRDYVHDQIYIPSGRSSYLSRRPIFATSKKRETGVDPIAMQFFRIYDMFCRVAERRTERVHGPIADELLGGDVIFRENTAYIENKDGRTLPFSLLSSGQQEFLPMYLIANDPVERSDHTGCEMWYVEEPETGLFPSAQSRAIDFLVSNLQGSDNRRHLTLTTHSPYILSKLNTYLKAGELGQDVNVASRVMELVSKECWLTPNTLKVYGLDNGGMKSLIGEDSLIDGSYIDDISEDIARIFTGLLEIQYQTAAE